MIRPSHRFTLRHANGAAHFLGAVALIHASARQDAEIAANLREPLLRLSAKQKDAVRTAVRSERALLSAYSFRSDDFTRSNTL